MIGIKHLEAFRAIVEEKSFTRAAEKLYQTQSALSKQIKVLEEYFEVELLIREEREIATTEAGEILYKEAEIVLNKLDLVKDKINELNGLAKGRVLLGSSSLPGEYIVPSLIAGFSRNYPAVEIQLKISDTKQILEALKKGLIQIAFLGAFYQERNCIIEPYMEDQLILIVPPDGSVYEEWEQIDMQKFIMREYGSGTRKIVETFLKSRGKGLGNIKEFGSTRAIINGVAAGMGISIVSRWAARDALALGKVKAGMLDKKGITRVIYAAILKEHSLSYAARAFWLYIWKNNNINKIT